SRFLRSMESDGSRSMMRPARSDCRVSSISPMMPSRSVASDSTAAVSGQQPSVRKRTVFGASFSPGSSGTRSSSRTSSAPLRTKVGRSFAKYSGTTSMPSRRMYSHTSSSVQSESGNTRSVSSLSSRVLKRPHGSGRCLRGSQLWPAPRSENTRSLARGIFVAARAADRGVETVCTERLPQRQRLHHVGVLRSRVDRIGLAHAFLVDVLDQVDVLFARDAVAELDHLAELPRRVDVQHRQRRLGGMERLQQQM